MDESQYPSESKPGVCKPLINACTPFLYCHNAFRISGLYVDASPRDCKRRIDDLKNAEEIGDSAEEHSHAFALDPPPNFAHIREAALKLQDPEQRIVEEFFWFWPMEWGSGKHDPALLALANGDKKTPFQQWTKTLSDDQLERSIVSKHNLAVMYQMTALDSELINLDKNLSEESLEKIDKYWHISFKWWEELTKDKVFWSLVSSRIRMLDDPRLTMGFAHRMRTTLPEALDKINALLAMQYIEKGKLDLARRQLVYMKETHQGLDDVPRTLAMVTAPLQIRIRDAIEKATRTAEQQPELGAQAALDLFKTALQPIEVITTILPPEDYECIDLCDAVAEAGLTCLNAFAREQRDWPTCLSILQETQTFAKSAQMRERIAEHFALAQGAVLLDPILQACEQVFLATKDKPEIAIMEAQHLLSSTKPMLSGLNASDAPGELKNQGKNEVAGTLMQCAVIYGNETEKWEPCIRLLEVSLEIAASTDMKEHISKNLHTMQLNAKMFENLKPISSAPSLSNFYGIGFMLYGASDHDKETSSYLSTYYFVFFAIPIFPICRYRVIPTPTGYRFLGKAPLRAFDKWHLLISCALIVMGAFFFGTGSDTGLNYGSGSSYSQPNRNSSSQPQSSNNSSIQNTLAKEIENDKLRLKQMEIEIEKLDGRLEELERQGKLYLITERIDEYNKLVPSFNALVIKRKKVYDEYSRLFDEVNSKVNRYNSGLR